MSVRSRVSLTWDLLIPNAPAQWAIYKFLKSTKIYVNYPSIIRGKDLGREEVKGVEVVRSPPNDFINYPSRPHLHLPLVLRQDVTTKDLIAAKVGKYKIALKLTTHQHRRFSGLINCSVHDATRRTAPVVVHFNYKVRVPLCVHSSIKISVLNLKVVLDTLG